MCHIGTRYLVSPSLLRRGIKGKLRDKSKVNLFFPLNLPGPPLGKGRGKRS
jgi:hypothetical protein